MIKQSQEEIDEYLTPTEEQLKKLKFIKLTMLWNTLDMVISDYNMVVAKYCKDNNDYVQWNKKVYKQLNEVKDIIIGTGAKLGNDDRQ